MSKTRNNHYVPRWYQEGFLEPTRNTLAYLDTTPPHKMLDDGRLVGARALFDAPTSRAFQQIDLYSTFFGTSVNDEIERRLFGDIDARGSTAVRAFAGTDINEWLRHFQTLFEYVDIQKIRTPKGLDWLKAQYPTLTQNELMLEMQGIRMMHCTIWTEGVREIVSAEEADVKFIVSDHPVTIYNYAAPPEAKTCAYPQDPTIALKASQTIFPLSRDFCLILTNLEYARDRATGPLDKRTFARHYRSSMVRTDTFIRKRKLSPQEVQQVNYILKRRARRYIAAGRKEWLYPERTVSAPWNELREVLLPPPDELWHFGGEMFARFEDGNVHYQDDFGRTEKERDFLKKEPPPAKSLRSRDMCGCGSGRSFKACCEPKPAILRPTWKERSIRERNILLLNAIVDVLALDSGKDWIDVRRDLTDEKIRQIYLLYESLWPRETEVLQLLPKPDGNARAIYTGLIHPQTIGDFALGASLYFGELLIQHPFLHAGTVKKDFNPVENPGAYHQEFLSTVLFFLKVMPLVELGLVNLVPDPCDFDLHLRDQMFHMAKSRSAGIHMDHRKDPRIELIMQQDFQRSIMSLPREVLRSQLQKVSPELDEVELEDVLRGMEQVKESDPLAVLQDAPSASSKESGRFNMMKLVPNYEMTMYLAQATGSCIVTDNAFRWQEIQRAVNRRMTGLAKLAHDIESASFVFPQDVVDIEVLASDKELKIYPVLMREIFKCLSRRSDREPKPNWEAHIVARFRREHSVAQAALKRASISVKQGRLSCVFPLGGIQDNTVNRLLLMSSSEKHLPSVPMAFFIKERDAD